MIKLVLLAEFLLLATGMSAKAPPPDLYGVPYLQEALNNAEARYQAGGPGVTEEEIVAFHNHLVDTLGLPDFARLTQEQLRTSRMHLSRLPVFGDLIAKPGENQNEVTHIVSPMAAAYLEDHMIEQKRFNPSYQMAPGEWSLQKAQEHQKLDRIDRVEGKNSGINHTSEIHKAMRAKGSLS